MTDFILNSACHAAEQTLLDQRLFMVSSSQYSALMDALDQPPKVQRWPARSVCAQGPVGCGVTLRTPEPLLARHRLDDFVCGKPALNDWLIRHARQAQSSRSAGTFVAAKVERVAGFFSLTVGQVDTLEAPERMRKGMGQYPVPVVILARLGVSVQD